MCIISDTALDLNPADAKVVMSVSSYCQWWALCNRPSFDLKWIVLAKERSEDVMKGRTCVICEKKSNFTVTVLVQFPATQCQKRSLHIQ